MINMSKKPNVFLIQVSEAGSKNILNNGKYRNTEWQSQPKNKDHGKVKQGDLLIIYFANAAIDHKKQLGMIYQVTKVSEGNGEFSMKPHKEITPLSLETIRENVSNGILDDVFLNCGRQGFNIKKIDYSNYEQIFSLSGTLPPAPTVVAAEGILEDFIVNNWNPVDFFGKNYAGLQILEDKEGNVIGQQYDTKVVGIIDLLCRDKMGNYVVIELKKDRETSDKAAGQLARYMGWAKANLAKNKDVVGIIVTGGCDEKLRYATSVISNSYIAVFEIDFRIKLMN
jgi:hypothetical protein